MRGIPPEERVAELVDGWALITPDGTEHTHVGRGAFTIAEEQLGPARARLPHHVRRHRASPKA
jgi:hypothetical protein